MGERVKVNIPLLLLAFGTAVVLIAGYIGKYVGFYRDVSLAEIQSPGFTVVYKEHVGAYHLIVPLLDEVEKWAKQNGVPCPKTFAEFLDDPNRTEEARLRANGGCWLGEGEVAIKAPLPGGFKTKFVSSGPMLKAEFSGSPAIGPWKVYPQAKGYMAEHHLKPQGPSFEIYTVLGERAMLTQYLFPY